MWEGKGKWRYNDINLAMLNTEALESAETHAQLKSEMPLEWRQRKNLRPALPPRSVIKEKETKTEALE